jgi:hypothetical protein
MQYSLNTPWQDNVNVTSRYLYFMCSAAIAQADDAESTTANTSDDGDTTSTHSSTIDGDAGRDRALKGTVSRDEFYF